MTNAYNWTGPRRGVDQLGQNLADLSDRLIEVEGTERMLRRMDGAAVADSLALVGALKNSLLQAMAGPPTQPETIADVLARHQAEQ